MRKLPYYFALGTIFLALLLIFIVGFWLLYPYKPLVLNTPKFKVLTPIVKQGGVLQYVSDYCKYMKLSATTTRSFVNGIIYNVPSIDTNRPCGCFKTTFQVDIPKELPVGKFYMHLIYKYKVNPIRTIVVEQNTEEFTVIESTASADLRLRSY